MNCIHFRYSILFFASSLCHEPEGDNPIARLAGVVLFRQAGCTCPPTAKRALPQVSLGKRAVAEVAGKAGETGGVFIGWFSLPPHALNVLPDTGEEVFLLHLLFWTLS